MTSKISLGQFIRLASDAETPKRVKILKNGNMIVLDLLDERALRCFSNYYFSRVARNAEFAYWVLREVIYYVENGSFVPVLYKKVRKVSTILAPVIHKRWHDLNNSEKDYFIDLPNRQSLLCCNKIQVQEQEGLHLLNHRKGNAIGADLDRLLLLDNLVIYHGKLVIEPSYNDQFSIEQLIRFIKERFQLSEELFNIFMETSDNSSEDNIFEHIFGKGRYTEEQLEEQEILKRFLMGLSQFQYQHASTILSQIFRQKNRIKFADDCHDNVAIIVKKQNIEVRHYFTLFVKSRSVCVRVDTVSHFCRYRWVKNKIAFTVQSQNNKLSSKEKKMQKLLKSFGY